MRKVDKLKHIKKVNKLTEVRQNNKRGVINENEMNELFGFSKQEKTDKKLESDLISAANEIDSYDFDSMIININPRNSFNDNKKIASEILSNASDKLPTVKKILPNLFGNPVIASLDIKKDDGKIYNAIIPAAWYKLFINDKDQYGGDNVVKAKLKQAVKNKVNFISKSAKYQDYQ